MTRPLFVPETPSAIYAVDGGSLTPTDDEQKAYRGGAPSLTEVFQDPQVHVERFRKQTSRDTTPRLDILKFTFTAEQNTIWITTQGEQLHLYLGPVLYQISPSAPAQTLQLVTGPGADTLYVDDSVLNPALFIPAQVTITCASAVTTRRSCPARAMTP